MSIFTSDDHCKNCVFKLNPKATKKDKLLCPFKRCIDRYGWTADQKRKV